MSVQGLVETAKRALGRLAGKESDGAPSESEMLAELAPRETTPAAADVIERADETILVLDVPGATRASTEVTVDGGRLEVVARRVDTRDPAALDWQRWFELSEAIDTSAVRADLRDGVLTIHLPKRAAERPRRVRIGRSLLSLLS